MAMQRSKPVVRRTLSSQKGQDAQVPTLGRNKTMLNITGEEANGL